jgi:hypothetical protein
MFRQLTPANHTYFAGHYRGEPFRCLRYCEVSIPNDPRVGAPPSVVAHWMRELRREINSGFSALDSHIVTTRSERLERLRYAVIFSCRVLELFLRIHPYANGNGHAGRLILWSVLGRYSHWPQHFPIEPRPAPPFVDFIKQYRDGDRNPLEMLILQSLIAP